MGAGGGVGVGAVVPCRASWFLRLTCPFLVIPVGLLRLSGAVLLAELLAPAPEFRGSAAGRLP